MKTAIIVFSTHLKLESLKESCKEVKSCDKVVFFTPQYVFDNEREFINSFIHNSEFVCFADLMSDADGERCDFDSFIPYKDNNMLKRSYMGSYFHDLTVEKNNFLVQSIEEKYHPYIKIVLSNDLGIVSEVWEKNGYQRRYGEYYNQDCKKGRRNARRYFNKYIFGRITKKLRINYPNRMFVSNYGGIKILFHGRLERAGYRMNLVFHKNRKEKLKFWLIKLLYVIFKIKINRKNVINLTTLHEYGNYAYSEMIDIPEFHNYIYQDGYLPPNDTCKYLFFYGKYTKFYSWDKLGNKIFEYHNIPIRIAPFSNKIPLPKPLFKKINRILCVSSGAGDWTALKNRSDEDKTAAAFAQIAALYPNIEIVYRCHPSWVGEDMQGVNSIKRLADYFASLNLSNIMVSSNIPSFFDNKGLLVVSQKRSSLDSDLQNADIVFGVHSISMLDAAMKKIPFASVNLSGRRNLFKGVTDLGFPHCESIDEICSVIESVNNQDWQDNYLAAINNYNKVTTEE